MVVHVIYLSCILLLAALVIHLAQQLYETAQSENYWLRTHNKAVRNAAKHIEDLERQLYQMGLEPQPRSRKIRKRCSASHLKLVSKEEVLNGSEGLAAAVTDRDCGNCGKEA